MSIEWEKNKKKEWEKNSDFWIKIIHKKLDPYRLKITNKAILNCFKKTSKGKCKILELGCGEGYMSRELAKKGYKVFSIDFCKELINKAEEIERKKPLGIKYFYQSANNLSNFKSNYFDFIVSHHFLNELKNPKKVFKECNRVLKRKGKFLALFLHPCFTLRNIEKNTEKYFTKQFLSKKFLVSGIHSPTKVNYLHLSLEGWSELFIENGFLISKIEEPHPDAGQFKKKFFKEKFKYPLFILMEGVKK